MLTRADAPSPQATILRDLERQTELLADQLRRLHAPGQANRAAGREPVAAISSQLWDMYQLASRLPLYTSAAPAAPAATPAATAA